MKQTLILWLFVCISAYSQTEKTLLASCCEGGKCTGSAYCTACKNCTGCKHCAKEGGSCGVCSTETPKKSNSNSGNSSSSSGYESTSETKPKQKTGMYYRKSLYVVSEKLHLREQPSTHAEILETINKGDEVLFIERHGDWIWVEVVNSHKTGYVYHTLVK